MVDIIATGLGLVILATLAVFLASLAGWVIKQMWCD